MMRRMKSLSVVQGNTFILAIIRNIKSDHPFWSYRRCLAYLTYRQGTKVNHKRIYRLRKKNDLLVNQKRYQVKGKIPHLKPKAIYPHQIWGTNMTKIKISS